MFSGVLLNKREKSVSDTSEQELKGVGGWLILVVIGLVITPFRVVYILMDSYWPIFRDGTWSFLTAPDSDAYHSLWGPLILFEIVGNLGAMILALVTLWFVFKKSKFVPKLAITWLGWNVGFVVIDFFIAPLIPVVAAQANTEIVRELVRSVVSAGIWIPYFLVSKRVRVTFVE